jgi:catalase
MSNEAKRPPLSHASGTPVTDNLNIQTATNVSLLGAT